jgi:hypothetical protein
MTRPTAGELAAFDQARTGCADLIDALIDTHRHVIATQGQRELHTVGLAHFLAHDVTHISCAELLAVSIDRLAHTPTPSSQES